jgi:hypothetical protein
MKNFKLFTLLFFTVSIYAQDIEWEKSYGGNQADYLFDAIPTADYGFVLAGSSLSKNRVTKQKLAVVIWIFGFGKWMKRVSWIGKKVLVVVVRTC